MCTALGKPLSALTNHADASPPAPGWVRWLIKAVKAVHLGPNGLKLRKALLVKRYALLRPGWWPSKNAAGHTDKNSYYTRSTYNRKKVNHPTELGRLWGAYGAAAWWAGSGRHADARGDTGEREVVGDAIHSARKRDHVVDEAHSTDIPIRILPARQPHRRPRKPTTPKGTTHDRKTGRTPFHSKPQPTKNVTAKAP